MDDAPTAPTTTADVAIVGAGAAGLAAAIFTAEAVPHARVVVLEGAKKIGAKILVSGGGRCNVTHDEVVPADFNGTPPVVRNVLAAFGVPAAVAWFESLGVVLKREETGKLFPVSDKAVTVVGALVDRCRALGVTVLTDHRVGDLTRSDGAPHPLRLQHERGFLAARRVVLATGGRSLPKSGSDGRGWEMVAKLGHTVTPTHQALVPLVFAEGTPFAALAGVSHDVELATFAAGKRVDQRRGSLLWTHVGISGPVVMDASRHWVIAAANGAKPELRLSVYPGEDFEAVDRRLTALAVARPKLSLLRLLAEHLPERAAATLVRLAELDPALPNSRLTRVERRRLVHTLTALALPVERARGWNYAEVTAGGVPLGEIDYRTMASRLVPGLHLIGEMLDCDGRIGGFNFQWAWATGHLAGRAAARAIADQENHT
ncbi:MAG: aminoacetone oxidase family FAD-binding enzyme [Candidatus Binatia bacterium]